MTYEYRFVRFDIGHEDDAKRLARFNALGAEGWAIVGIISGIFVIMQRATP